MQTIELSKGPVRYSDTGQGPTLVFVHGLLVSGALWRKVVPELSRRFRCIVPDWPLGSHQLPMNRDADLSPGGVADLIAEFLEKMDLRDVTLIGNDSGGALCQLLITRRPERVGRLVLTTCDAFEVFPPPLFTYLSVVARIPGLLWLMAAMMRLVPSMRRLPIAYGKVAKYPLSDETLDLFTAPSAKNRGVRRDLLKFLRSISPKWTMEAAKDLHSFKRPVLILWTPEDTSFPLSLGERLQQALPQARLEEISDSWVFVAEDRPEELVSRLSAFCSPR
jgi:pimeloyl-ACP methyl ester carboxylesterase